MSKWDKLERNVEKGKKLSILSAQKSIADEKNLASLAKQRDFQKNWSLEKYEQGIKWYESGLALEDAPQELQNNDSFFNGFNVAARRAFAAELEKEAKHR